MGYDETMLKLSMTLNKNKYFFCMTVVNLKQIINF